MMKEIEKERGHFEDRMIYFEGVDSGQVNKVLDDLKLPRTLPTTLNRQSKPRPLSSKKPGPGRQHWPCSAESRSALHVQGLTNKTPRAMWAFLLFGGLLLLVLLCGVYCDIGANRRAPCIYRHELAPTYFKTKNKVHKMRWNNCRGQALPRLHRMVILFLTLPF
jgi:hypothetical protein